jgi:hypothetical protein
MVRDQKISDTTPKRLTSFKAMAWTVEAFPHGIEGAGADITVHHAQSRDGQFERLASNREVRDARGGAGV